MSIFGNYIDKFGTAPTTGMYIVQVGPFFPPTGPDQGRFFPLFLFSFSVLRAQSDTFYGLKLVHSALKALTKPLHPKSMPK